MIRAPIRPSATRPPTTPPTIAGILVLEGRGEPLGKEVDEGVEVAVPAVGGREDSTPFIDSARVTLNVSETYDDDTLAISLQS